ncbi:MAG TPA: hypothetical protein EYQ82_05960 [Dehalococcoidia bacterium]|nr:hypothetical protein [Dehalococcoidia bacterium]HIK98201.1 hypothetical protein [Dehalococcoidia bacterium]
MIFYEDPEEAKGSLRLRVCRNLLLGWAMFVALSGVGIISLLILFPPMEAIYQSITVHNCESAPPHKATIDIGDATLLRVIGDRGDLSVIGRTGRTSIHIEGRTCAALDSKHHLESVALNTSVTDFNEILVSVVLPAEAEDIRMDLEIIVPADFPRVEIANTDGPVYISNILNLQAAIGYGNLDATHIGGTVNVLGLEGSMSLVDIEGDVNVTLIEGYGEVDLARIGGNVIIDDNRSGPARISDIGGNVTIGSAGYGHLTVTDIAGDLSVDKNPGGDIIVEEINGSVDIPVNEDRSGT